ncbi:MAG: tyrosine-type recombinase/integrase, partial [Planctomycetaceae bacterium]
HSSGQARVRVDGRDILLGEFNSRESRVRYAEILAQLVSGQPVAQKVPRKGRQAQQPDPGISINELAAAYLTWADGHFLKNGKPTSEIHCIKSAVKPLVDLYGFTPCDGFGPLALKAVREKMVASGWCRNTINRNVSRVRAVFRWGVENEMVQAATLQKLQAVAPILAGRTEAPDNAPRQPATDEQVAAVRPFVSPLIWDLIQVQRLTGARGGELLSMTPGAVDRSKSVWLYAVDDHKTAHHGHARTVAIGPRAQEVLAARMQGLGDDELVFPVRRDSYTTAVARAVEKYNRKHPHRPIEPWSPHQLRHAKAHEVREKFGLEHTQATLGHSTFEMAERY